MKTILSQKVLIAVAVLSMAVVSCKKDSLVVSNTNGSVNNANLPSGSIMDLGYVAPDAKEMTTALTTQNFTLVGDNLDLTGTGAEIIVAMYANSDGVIPEGSYVFSSASEKQPFTFDSGILKAPVDLNSTNNTSFEITNGMITVSHSGTSEYIFNFQFDLSSGISFSGSFSGNMTYNVGIASKK
jgi:hypothetical protein